MSARLAARLLTSGPAFLLGLLVELAGFARDGARARRRAGRKRRGAPPG